jgi:hypothetical protein
VQSIPVPHRINETAHGKLGTRILAAHKRHYLATTFSAYRIQAGLRSADRVRR